MSKTVAIIIVSWNSWDLMERCLSCLEAQTFQDFSVTVMDNDSLHDRSAEHALRHPRVTFIQSGSNLGFSAANNLAVEKYTGDSPWIALLNADAFAQPDWLAQLMAASQAHPDCSVFASRQLDASNLLLLDGDGDCYHMSGRAWRTVVWDNPPAGPPSDDASAALPQVIEAPKKVFSPCGAAALYRRSAYMSLGGLDEDFFCYFEDVDLGFRLHLAGYRCLLVPTAVVHHLGSGSTGGAHNDFAVYHGHRNMVWSYVKNMPSVFFWLFLPMHISFNLATILVYWRNPSVILRSKKDAVLGIPKMLKKRRAIQSQRRATLADIWRILDKRLF